MKDMDITNIVDEVIEFLTDKLDVPFLNEEQERLLFSFILQMALSFLSQKSLSGFKRITSA